MSADSQDAIGIVFPGLNRLDYAKGEYWPEKITPVNDPEVLDWIERSSVVHNIAAEGREISMSLIKRICRLREPQALAKAADDVWECHPC